MQPLNLFSLSYFDWLVVAVALFSVFTAFRRGLVATVFSLSGLIAGLLIATSVHAANMDSLARYAAFDAPTRKMLLLGMVLVVYTAFKAVSAFARRIAAGAGLGLTDRFAGAGLGLVRGALLAALLLVAGTGLIPHSSLIQSSVLAPYLIHGTQATALLDSAMFTDPADPGTNRVLPALQQSLEARDQSGPAPQ